MTKPEFQAIVMAAGKGSRIPEMTSDYPKCLLPVANHPMIWYPLKLLEKTGFKDCIVIVQESVRSDVQQALDGCNLSLELDIVGIPAGEDWGTADSLRHIHEKIESDVVIVSCDTISEISLSKLLNQFRVHQASLATLFFKSSDVVGAIPGPKVKYKADRDIVGLDNNSRLVFLASASDFEETLSLPSNLITKHQNITMQSRLTDSHIYVVKKWICDFLSHESSMSTIKGELLPYIVRKQLFRSNQDSPSKIQKVSDLMEFVKDGSIDDKVAILSSYTDHSTDLNPAYHNDVIRCYAVVAEKEKFGMRANTLSSYSNINVKILEHWSAFNGVESVVRISPKADVKSTQIVDDCLVGDYSVLAEKTSFKHSFIGNNCTIEPKCRIVNSIIMNNVKIQEGCVITNSVICNGAEVNLGSELKDCLVGSHHIVPPNGKHVNEILTKSDGLMEI